MDAASAPRRPVILLVQPEETGEMYAEYLRHAGLDALLCTNGADALQLAPRSSLIVTAIRIVGRMDGIELVASIRADRRTAATPVIVLTAMATPDRRERALAAGGNLFLAKPCLPDELLRHIKELLLSEAQPQPRPAKASHSGSGSGRDGRGGLGAA